jgi:hypothetical protein
VDVGVDEAGEDGRGGVNLRVRRDLRQVADGPDVGVLDQEGAGARSLWGDDSVRWKGLQQRVPPILLLAKIVIRWKIARAFR